MTIEGEVVMRIASRAGCLAGLRVEVRRPHVAERLLAGRAAADAAALASTLFAICAGAQSIAAEAATDAAQERDATRAKLAWHERRLAAETVREHLWRALLDWPRLAREEARPAWLARAREVASALDTADASDARHAARALTAWVSEHVLGEPPGDFLARASLADFDRWVASDCTQSAGLVGRLLAAHAPLGASDVALLEPCSERLARELAEAIAHEPDFALHPHMRGEARETGVLARNARHPLVADAVARWGCGVGARLVARFVDLAAVLASLEAPGKPRCGAVTLGDGAGIAWVETARGLLLHFARVRDERIRAYRIVAPTEWNFHPAGALARGAAPLHAADDAALEDQLRWLAASLDPCAALRLEMGHA